MNFAINDIVYAQLQWLIGLGIFGILSGGWHQSQIAKTIYEIAGSCEIESERQMQPASRSVSFSMKPDIFLIKRTKRDGKLDVHFCQSGTNPHTVFFAGFFVAVEIFLEQEIHNYQLGNLCRHRAKLIRAFV